MIVGDPGRFFSADGYDKLKRFGFHIRYTALSTATRDLLPKHTMVLIIRLHLHHLLYTYV